jgi:Flp pilus assembly protein TadG
MRRQRRARRHGGQGCDERGAVTAELALGLPLLLAVTVGLVWMVSLAATQVQVIDASREAARAIARGDDQAASVALARRIAPSQATVAVDVSGDQVVVTTRARARAPGRLLSALPRVVVSAEAVAVMEEP